MRWCPHGPSRARCPGPGTCAQSRIPGRLRNPPARGFSIAIWTSCAISHTGFLDPHLGARRHGRAAGRVGSDRRAPAPEGAWRSSKRGENAKSLASRRRFARKTKPPKISKCSGALWLRGLDLNQRPLGYALCLPLQRGCNAADLRIGGHREGRMRWGSRGGRKVSATILLTDRGLKDRGRRRRADPRAKASVL
jgi:hypothetical protein